jgi:ribulose-5-phosphate 4-epimerase/fuculose-1-phosphate aldolase
VSAELRRRIAVGCRILAHAGLCEDILGHVSGRLDDDTILVRSRGPHERGVLFTAAEDVRPFSLTRRAIDEGSLHAPPNELPIHVACYRADPAIGAVVHAHPPAVVAADLAGIPLVPMIGAYHIPAAGLAAAGIAVYPRGVLINTDELGREMVEAMDGRPVCVLRGHGLTTTGTSVEQAVARALAVDSLARMACHVAQLGATPVALPTADLAQLPDLGSAFNDDLLWRHHEQRLEVAGLGLGAPWSSTTSPRRSAPG